MMQKGDPVRTAFSSLVIAVGIALPLHLPYEIGTLDRLGPSCLDAPILPVGTAIAFVGLPSAEQRHAPPTRKSATVVARSGV